MDEHPLIYEKRVSNQKNIFKAIRIGFFLLVIDIFALFYFSLDLLSFTTVSAVIVAGYSIILFFLLEPQLIREIHHTHVETVETPVIKEIVVDRPVQVIKEVIREVEKPFAVVKEVYRPITSSRSLDIPKYDYLGSSETKTYHSHNCRLSKLIKKKFKLSSNSQAFFRSRGFKPCKICIRK